MSKVFAHTALLLLLASSAAAVQSPFLPTIAKKHVAQQTKEKVSAAPTLPVEEIIYYDEKSKGDEMQALVIDYRDSLQIDGTALKTVTIKEGQRLATVSDSEAQLLIGSVSARIFSDSALKLSEMRSFDHHNEIAFHLEQGSIRLVPGEKYVGALSITTPRETIVSHNANLILDLDKKAVWNVNGSVEIINENQKLILMPGERADRRGSVWFVSALLNPDSLGRLKKSYALRGEQKTDGTVVASRHYVKTVRGVNQP